MVVCDKCKSPISMETPIKVDSVKGMARQYIECPECGTKYTIAVYDGELVEMLKVKDLLSTAPFPSVLPTITKLNKCIADKERALLNAAGV